MTRVGTAGLLAIVALAWPACGMGAPRASAMEPPAGTLPDGRAMLIDDGTCPAGTIKQIVGGNLKSGTLRARSCIRR